MRPVVVYSLSVWIFGHGVGGEIVFCPNGALVVRALGRDAVCLFFVNLLVLSLCGESMMLCATKKDPNRI